MNKLAAILISLVTFFAITAMAGSPIRKSPEDAVSPDGEIDNLLRQLDSVLAKSPDIVRAKEARIAARRGTYASALDEEHRYWAAADLYEEYSTFDSDSALHYADLALSHARALDRRDLMAEAELNRSYIFSATGLIEEADKSLHSVKPDSLPTSLAVKYTSEGFDRVKGDQMGMCATVINSLALSSALGAIGVRTKVLTAIRMEPIGEFYTKWRAIEAMEAGYICIFSAGTGSPYFTTDTGSSLRGIEIEAEDRKSTRLNSSHLA